MKTRQKQPPSTDTERQDKSPKDEQKVITRREKNRLKVQEWRKKQRENKAKYEQLKKVDRERRKEARSQKRQQSLSDPELRQELKRKKRDEMKRYRQKKKDKKSPSVSASKDKFTKKEKKTNAVKRTQMWRMRLKLKEGTQQEACSSKNDEPTTDTPEKVIPKTSLYRQIKKVKTVLPSTPRSKAIIIRKLIESPSTSKVLQKKNIIMTPECKKKLEMTDSIVESVKESISSVKTKKHGAKKHAHNIICDSVLRKYKRHRLKKYFNVSIKARRHRSTWWEQKQRKRRKDAIDNNIKDSVRSFFLSPEISREVPNKRETVKIRHEGQKVILHKHVMTMTLEEAYTEYKSRNPEHKIGLTSFSKLKPVNVKKVSETSRRSCLCQKCCNVALKIEALTTLKKVVKEKGNMMTCDDIPVDKKNLCDATFCKYETTSDVKCLRRECQHCGVKCLRNYLKPLIDQCSDRVVSWHQWESVEIAKDDKIKRCVSCVPKEADIAMFVTCLEKDMQEYPEHIFRATWQQQQMKMCIDKQSEGSVVMVMDFSENYGCVFQSEVQSGFFDRNQVTLHPMMCYYKEVHEEKEYKVKHAIVGISEDTKHDADLAIAFENQAIELLEQKGVKIDHVHEWTDGCAAQYKGKKAFADISLRTTPSITRNYFETSHGKNVCDGLGATVKNACLRAVVSNRKVIGCADDVFDFCTQKLTMDNTDIDGDTVSRREFILVKGAKRNRDETNVQTLVGTRKLHAVKSVGNAYDLSTRNLSCYCEPCVEDSGICSSRKYVNAWEMRKLTVISETSSQTKQQTNKQNPPAQGKRENHSQKRKSTELQNIAAKKSRLENKGSGSTKRPTESKQYNPGEFVAVGLKPKKGPLCVYFAEVMTEFDTQVQLKYMRKSGKWYTWPDKEDQSQEPLHVILCRVQAPEIVSERGHFRFNANDLMKIKADLEQNHKHFYWK